MLPDVEANAVSSLVSMASRDARDEESCIKLLYFLPEPYEAYPKPAVVVF